MVYGVRLPTPRHGNDARLNQTSMITLYKKASFVAEQKVKHALIVLGGKAGRIGLNMATAARLDLADGDPVTIGVDSTDGTLYVGKHPDGWPVRLHTRTRVCFFNSTALCKTVLDNLKNGGGYTQVTLQLSGVSIDFEGHILWPILPLPVKAK